jgi:hypothetical protein
MDDNVRTAVMVFLGETADGLTQLSEMVKGTPHNIKHAADTAALHFRQLLTKAEQDGPDAETIRQVTEAALSLTEYVSESIKGSAELSEKYKNALAAAESTIFYLTASLSSPVLCW